MALSLANLHTSSREALFIAAIIRISVSVWINLCQISSPPTMTLFIVGISSCRYAKGLPICAVTFNFSDVSIFVSSCLVITASFNQVYSFETIIVDSCWIVWWWLLMCIRFIFHR